MTARSISRARSAYQRRRGESLSVFQESVCGSQNASGSATGLTDTIGIGGSRPQAATQTTPISARDRYRFRVIASNADGVWNAAETAIAFHVLPLYWQTGWFLLVSLLAAGFGVLLLYRIRIHQLAGRLNLGFEARLAERTRIAQELHDTLLQGFLSASMHLQCRC